MLFVACFFFFPLSVLVPFQLILANGQNSLLVVIFRSFYFFFIQMANKKCCHSCAAAATDLYDWMFVYCCSVFGVWRTLFAYSCTRRLFIRYYIARCGQLNVTYTRSPARARAHTHAHHSHIDRINQTTTTDTLRTFILNRKKRDAGASHFSFDVEHQEHW